MLNGIGNTIRVSLSDSPIEEVKAGINILQAVGLRKDFVEIISCPTCARTEFDVITISKQLRESVKNIRKPMKIAVMGCVVNGIGEGESADYGVAGGKEQSLIFSKGKILYKIDNSKVFECLMYLMEGKNE
ncbi:MAG: hypothetical protein EOM87_06525 [Clostridia bacterium]|nr:hypothetical protein [Clostridia bacterium]